MEVYLIHCLEVIGYGMADLSDAFTIEEVLQEVGEVGLVFKGNRVEEVDSIYGSYLNHSYTSTIEIIELVLELRIVSNLLGCHDVSNGIL